MKRSLRYMIPALAVLLAYTAQAAITTNLLVKFEGSLVGTAYTLGAGEIDTTGTFVGNGTPTLVDILGETHADLDGSAALDSNADGFKVDPSGIGTLTDVNWVAEAVVAFETFSGGQLTMIDVQGDTDFRINNAADQLEAGFWDGGNYNSVLSALPPELNFVHLALVWDAGDTTLTAYTNGVSIGVANGSAFAVPDANNLSFGYLGRATLEGRGINGLLHAVSFATSDTTIVPADFLINSLPPNPPEPTGPPEWDVDPINGGSAFVDNLYSNTLAGAASDPDGDSIIYLHVGGPDWLMIETNGVMHGTPGVGDVGTNVFTVGAGAVDGTNNATLNIVVIESSGSGIIWEPTATPITDVLDIINDGDPALGLDITKDDWPSGTTTFSAPDGALDFGPDGGTVNGVVFAVGGGSDDYWTPNGGASTGDATLDGIIDTHNAFGSSTDPFVILVEGLAENTNYKVQIIGIHDLRDGIADRTTTYVSGSGSSPTLARGTGGSVIGTFSTGPGETTFTINALGAADPGAGAIVIRKIGLPPGDAVTASITGPVDGGSGMVISWTSQAAYTYTVQTNSNLIVANWEDWVTGVPGNGSTVSVTNAIGPEQVFYQVITE